MCNLLSKKRIPFWVILTILTLDFATSKAQIINVEDKRVRLGDSIAFKGFVDMGLNFVKNDRMLTLARGSMQLERAYKRHFLMLIGGYNLTKASGQNFQNDGFSHLRYNYDVKPRVVFEAFTQAQYNQRTRILFRGLVGSGLRFKFRLSPKQRFYLGTALMYEMNRFSTLQEQADVRLTNYLSYNLNFKNGSRIVHTTYFQPILTNFGNNRVSSDASLLVQLSKKLVFRASANLSYDNDPRLPESVPDFVYAWTNGLRLEF